MRTYLMLAAPLAAVVAASACTFGTIIGTDSPGGGTSSTTSTATGGGPSSTTTSGASSSTGTTSTSSSTSTDAGSSSGFVAPACDPTPTFDAKYTDEAQFDQTAVGRWARCSGPAQLPNETVGIEFTASHELYALADGGGGTVVRAQLTPDGLETWSLSFNGTFPELTFSWANDPPNATLTIGGPIFYDGGQQMYLTYLGAPATYRRLPATSGDDGGTSTGDDGGTSTGDGGGTSTGAPAGGCWDGTPVSQAGGPCGGNHYANPPTCAAGLVCNVSPSIDFTGTCAASGVQVGGFGGECGGSSNTICPFDHMCQEPAAPGQPGTCITAPCVNGYDGGPDDGCASPFLSLVGDGTPAEFDFACAGWPNVGPNPSSAVGYIGNADAGAPQISIVGCRLPVLPENQTGIIITAPLTGVGSTTAASLNAIGLNNPAVNNGTTSVQITAMDAVTITGTYSAVAQLANGGGTASISGAFRVCRAPDVQPQ